MKTRAKVRSIAHFPFHAIASKYPLYIPHCPLFSFKIRRHSRVAARTHVFHVTLHVVFLNSRGSTNLIIGAKATPQPSTRDPKPAGWESWSKERQKEWWAPRNAARKARKRATRQQQQQQQKAVETATRLANKAKAAIKSAEEAAEKVKKLRKQETAEKAATEKTASSERTQELTGVPTGSGSQTPQFWPSQQYQQGRPAGYTQFGRGGLPGAAYQAFSSPYGTSHPLPPRPAAALPVVTAGVPPTMTPAQAGGNKAVQKSKKKRNERKAEEKKSEDLEQALERIRVEERKKMEEERESMEKERKEIEEERKSMEKERKEMEEEREKMEEERKKEEG